MSETQAVDWERHGLNPAFLAWRESGALAPCRILIPGGGRSLEPLAMAEAGFDVTVVDLAATAVAMQRARLERLKVPARIEQADLFAWDPDRPFDAVYDQTCLCALPPALWPNYARRLHRWLRPNSTLFILFMQSGKTDAPPFHCDLDAMRRLFGLPAWTWPGTLQPLVPHPSVGLGEQPAILRRN
jgi:hypothetical protein